MHFHKSVEDFRDIRNWDTYQKWDVLRLMKLALLLESGQARPEEALEPGEQAAGWLQGRFQFRPFDLACLPCGNHAFGLGQSTLGEMVGRCQAD